jgi:hypothetical protein
MDGHGFPGSELRYHARDMAPPPRLPVPPDWPSLLDLQILDLRLAVLPLSIADSALTARTVQTMNCLHSCGCRLML